MELLCYMFTALLKNISVPCVSKSMSFFHSVELPVSQNEQRKGRDSWQATDTQSKDRQSVLAA